MKNKVVKILVIGFLLIVLISILFIKLTSDKEVQNIPSTTETASVSAAGFDEEGSEKIQRAQALAEKMQNSVPPEIFGGLYFDDNQNLVVNVTDLTDDSVLQLKNDADSQYITFRQVKYTLAFLESVRIELIPFMAEYDIATIDANEVTNKIDIELYRKNKEVESLLSKYIDLEAVSITVLSDDVEICFSHEKLDETNSEIWAISQTEEEIAVPYATTVLYPGIQIIKGGYGYTMGPRYSSSQFKTAGHAALDSTSTSFYITVAGINRTVGAGVFSSNAININGYCYGTQSIGVFQNGSSTSSYSYFSYI